jgi:hypothetical protein
MRCVAEQIYDFEEMARRARGRHWRQRPLTGEQRSDFIRFFREPAAEGLIITEEGSTYFARNRELAR